MWFLNFNNPDSGGVLKYLIVRVNNKFINYFIQLNQINNYPLKPSKFLCLALINTIIRQTLLTSYKCP